MNNELNNMENMEKSVELELSLTKAEMKSISDENAALKAQLEELRRKQRSPAIVTTPQSAEPMKKAIPSRLTRKFVTSATAAAPSQSTVEETAEPMKEAIPSRLTSKYTF